MGTGEERTPSKFEETQIRRDIAKECIYGVDKNAVAVELAKLSMWLETLATDQPLAFLDHHLKHGDALVGSDIDEQATFTSFTERRENVIEMLIEVFEDLFAVPNETIEDARAMNRIYYEQILGNPTYKRFKQIANVHTANEFGLDWTQESAFERSGLRSDAFQYMAEVLDDDKLWDGDPARKRRSPTHRGFRQHNDGVASSRFSIGSSNFPRFSTIWPPRNAPTLASMQFSAIRRGWEHGPGTSMTTFRST